MPRWFIFLVILGLPVSAGVRAEESSSAVSVWGTTTPSTGGLGGTPATGGATGFEGSAVAPKILTGRGISEEDSFIKSDGKRHWKNVPKHAWLLLAGCLGLLGVFVYFRTRPPRENLLKPIVIIGGDR